MRLFKELIRRPFRAIVWLAAFVLKTWLVGRIVGINRENVPRKGALVVAPNHFSSGEDPGLFLLLMPGITVMYKKDLEGTNLLSFLPGLLVRFFLRGADYIPTRRGQKELVGIARMHEELRKGRRILAMPEGTSRHTELIEARRRGIAREAVLIDCPVLPVALYGTAHALTDGILPWRKHKIIIVYGKPLQFSRIGITAENDPTGERATTEVMVRIAAMLSPEMRGFYASHTLEFLASDAPDVGFYRGIQPLVHRLR